MQRAGDHEYNADDHNDNWNHHGTVEGRTTSMVHMPMIQHGIKLMAMQ